MTEPSKEGVGVCEHCGWTDIEWFDETPGLPDDYPYGGHWECKCCGSSAVERV